MKTLLIILIPLILIGYFAGKALPPAGVTEQHNLKVSGENRTEQVKKVNVHNSSTEQISRGLSCKSCHVSEYPTKNDPGLVNCPRTDMVSVYHSPAEGPEVVVIDEMSDYYTGVVFSHRVHAEMSQMSEGCTGCHHYNTTGPVLNCRKCHEGSRNREDISAPDLKAAYHRQCMTCHKQWSAENGCNNLCHKRKDPVNGQKIDSIARKTHPKLTLPDKIVWETKSKINKTVTFFHDEHIQIFKINCTSCHSQENCIKCHSLKARSDANAFVKIEKSAEEHHKTCSACHTGNACVKCHQNKEQESFNHGKTTSWVLKSYHAALECSKCHGVKMPYRKLDNNCASCHKIFTSAFDHKLVGFVFSDNHRDLECSNCHQKKDFSKAPVCTDCHDDKSFPADVPGKKVRK